MATPAQIAANRANAQRSTGPRTDEGKLRASQNALRHGLCSAIPEMHDEGDQNHDQLLAALREEHQPATPTEEILVYKMAEHFCYAKRASYLLSEQLDSNDHGDDNAREIGLFMRYHAQSDRGFYRALTELRKTQMERRCPRVQPDATTYPSAACSQTQQLILPTSDVQREDTGQEPPAMERDRSIGSVSSTPGAARGSDLSFQVATHNEKIPVNEVPAEAAEIGSVPQDTADQAASPHFTPETPVSVTAPREDNWATYPPNQTSDRDGLPCASGEISVSNPKISPVSPQRAA